MRAFTRATTKTKHESAKTDIALIWLCEDLQRLADKGHVVLLYDVWERYNELAEDKQAQTNQVKLASAAISCWRRSIVVRTLVSAGELSLSCARLLAG